MGTELQGESTILYVDDQPSHRVLFERTFRGDWLVLTASSAEEGLNLLKEHDVFLVIADHNMPGVTGIEFLTQARELSPRTVRAVLSAYGSREIRAEATRKAEIAAFLEKPWDRNQVRQFIGESLGRYQLGQTEAKAPEPFLERLLKEGELWKGKLAELAAALEEKVDERGKKRIILNFSEPRLKNFVPLIRRPIPEPLARAQQAALSGELSEFEKALLDFLKSSDAAPSPEPERH